MTKPIVCSICQLESFVRRMGNVYYCLGCDKRIEVEKEDEKSQRDSDNQKET